MSPVQGLVAPEAEQTTYLYELSDDVTKENIQCPSLKNTPVHANMDHRLFWMNLHRALTASNLRVFNF